MITSVFSLYDCMSAYAFFNYFEFYSLMIVMTIGKMGYFICGARMRSCAKAFVGGNEIIVQLLAVCGAVKILTISVISTINFANCVPVASILTH